MICDESCNTVTVINIDPHEQEHIISRLEADALALKVAAEATETAVAANVTDPIKSGQGVLAMSDQGYVCRRKRGLIKFRSNDIKGGHFLRQIFSNLDQRHANLTCAQ